jgi:hypothetical protein
MCICPTDLKVRRTVVLPERRAFTMVGRTAAPKGLRMAVLPGRRACTTAERMEEPTAAPTAAVMVTVARTAAPRSQRSGRS